MIQPIAAVLVAALIAGTQAVLDSVVALSDFAVVEVIHQLVLAAQATEQNLLQVGHDCSEFPFGKFARCDRYLDFDEHSLHSLSPTMSSCWLLVVQNLKWGLEVATEVSN